MEKNNLEQRYANKYRVKLGEGTTDTYEKIQSAFSNDSVSHAQVFQWHKDFVNGREMVKDELRSACPVSARTGTNVNHVRAFICQNRHLAIWMTANELNINEYTVHQIVTQDVNCKKCAKMVPKNVMTKKGIETKC